MSERADLLDALVAHPGWKLFVDHMGEEWGPKAYANRLKAAVAHARQVGTDASHAIELVDAGNDAIAEAMQWPSEESGRVKRAEQQPAAVSMARGGYNR